MMHERRLRARLGHNLAFAFLLLTAVACGEPTGSDGTEERVDLGLLFAPPTQDEIAQVAAEWETRDVTAQGVSVVASAAVGAEAVVQIVSHDVGGVTHYGAIRIPDGAAAGSLPVVVIAHGGDTGVDVDEWLALLGFGFGTSINDYVLVVPSFRSEPLTFQGNTHVSTGEPSPWDKDVDDALALLNVAIVSVPAASADRIGVVGLSRGACVGLLMAIRDPRIDVVVEFFGPTDFFGTFVRGVVEDALSGTPPDLPGVDYLNTHFIQPLDQGQLTIDNVRLELVRRSPVYYANLLPDVQIHHGTGDLTVPVSEAQRLIAVMQVLGRGQPDFDPHIYQGGGHDALLLPGSIESTVAFIGRLSAAARNHLAAGITNKE